MKGIVIPIVCGASLFDCSVGNPIAYPDKAMGYNAAEDAMENNQMITSKFGAGTGAIGAVNAVDDVFEPNSNIPIAGIYDQVNMHRLFSEDIILNSDHVDSSPLANTTIACIVTNANLNKHKRINLLLWHMMHMHIRFDLSIQARMAIRYLQCVAVKWLQSLMLWQY